MKEFTTFLNHYYSNSFGSCKKKSCKSITCYNEGKCVEDACICPEGYTGPDCNIKSGVESLECNYAYFNGTLIAGVDINAITLSIPYKGGNGGAYPNQTILSEGLTGIIASLPASNFELGSDTLKYIISGNSKNQGKAIFNVNVGDKSCIVTLNVWDSTIVSKYPAGSIFCESGPSIVVDIIKPVTGKFWMDRNLGATQVANSYIDSLAYGDLYQWGRSNDGHQCRNSPINSSISSSSNPRHGCFIITNSSTFNDWLSLQNADLWKNTISSNNPCPIGYRLPTETELNNERLSWSSNNSIGGFNSPLKFTNGGARENSNGDIGNANDVGVYWSSNVNGTESRVLFLNSVSSNLLSSVRGAGYSIRCIKD